MAKPKAKSQKLRQWVLEQIMMELSVIEEMHLSENDPLQDNISNIKSFAQLQLDPGFQQYFFERQAALLAEKSGENHECLKCKKAIPPGMTCGHTAACPKCRDSRFDLIARMTSTGERFYTLTCTCGAMNVWCEDLAFFRPPDQLDEFKPNDLFSQDSVETRHSTEWRSCVSMAGSSSSKVKKINEK